MISSYRNLSLRYLKRQKKRTILNILGVLMSAALITGTGTIIESVKNQLISSAVAQEGNFHVCFKNITDEQRFFIENHMKIEESCTGKIDGFAVLAETGNDEIPYRLLRLNQNDRNAMKMLQIENNLTEGRLPQTVDEIAVELSALKVLGPDYGIGSRITLDTGVRRRVSNNEIITGNVYPLSIKGNEEDPEEYFSIYEKRSFLITGILSENYYMSKNYSTNAVTYGESGNNMLVLLNDLADVRGTAESIADSIGLEHSSILYNHRLLNVSGNAINDDIRGGMLGFNFIVIAIIVLATIAVIYNSFNISLIERITQLGVMRCIGAAPAQIRDIILREAGLICLMAIPPGVIIGLSAMKIVFSIADALTSNPLFEGIVLIISPRVIISSVIICIVTVLISAFFPALKAGRIPAIEAVRSTGMYSHDRLKKKRRSSSRGFSTIMAFRNISRNRKRFLVTLFSMAVSVVLFVSFGGMLRLVNSLYLLQEDNMPGIMLESENAIEAEIYDRLTAVEPTDLMIKYSETEISIVTAEGKLSESYRKYVDALQEFERNDGNIVLPGCRILCYGDGALPELEKYLSAGSMQGKTRQILLVQKAMFRNNTGKKTYAPNSLLKPGESIGLNIAGKKIDIKIGAVLNDVYYQDFNDNEGGIDIVVDEKTYMELTGTEGFRKMFIRLKPGSSKETLIAELERITNTRIGYSYIDAQAQAEEMTRETVAIEIFFYGFIIVIALISCLNVINTISTNLLIRSHEFGIIQAVGLDKSGLRNMILKESIIYSSGALLLGGTAGTALWYFLVKNMSNIRLAAFQVPWQEIGIAAAGLIIITLLSGWFPLKRIDKKSIIENIKFEE